MSAPKNLPASVKARLLNLAGSRGESFNELLGRYAVERLLYRLGQSQHADRFLLKGAMLFVLWDGQIPRPTRDVDFLGFGQIEVEAVAAAFREIAATPAPPDGLEFIADSVTAEEIREGQGYGGVRVKMVAQLGTGRIPLQVDIGSGDAVTPGPEETDFPVLLDFPAPRVRAYPVYTVVAEKFEAIVSLGVRNTRMKDFHHLWFLSGRFDFDGDTFHRAIEATRVPILAATMLEGQPEHAAASQLGGRPWWPAGRPYPIGRNGQPLYLLLQINFDDAPVLEGFPDHGLMQLFISPGDHYGCNIDDPIASEGFACVFHASTDGPQIDRLPELVAGQADLPLKHPLVAIPLSIARQTMLMDLTDHRFPKQFPEIWADVDLAEAYQALTSDAAKIRLGGYPTFTQDDPRSRLDLGDVTLATIDSTTNIMWGDVGAAQFFIASRRLAQRDFSQVAYHWDCC